MFILLVDLYLSYIGNFSRKPLDLIPLLHKILDSRIKPTIISHKIIELIDLNRLHSLIKINLLAEELFLGDEIS